MKSSRRLSRVASNLPKPPVLANLYWRTTRVPRVLRAIFNSRRRSLPVSKQENTRRVPGKGLGSLLPARQQAPAPQLAAPAPVAPPSEPATEVAIDLIDANPLQPRRVFQAEKLAELAQSIRSNGIIQPLVVRKADGRY